MTDVQTTFKFDNNLEHRTLVFLFYSAQLNAHDETDDKLVDHLGFR